MNERDEIVITAPPDVVWRVYADVERWPTWTASMKSVELLDGATELGLGVRARIAQPRLPRAVWTVTAIEPGHGWTWVTRSPGATTTAGHELTDLGDGTTRVVQTITQGGPLGAIIGRLAGRLTRRYLRMEAEGLRTRVESGAAAA